MQDAEGGHDGKRTRRYPAIKNVSLDKLGICHVSITNFLLGESNHLSGSVDADDTVRYFSHENLPKIFPRTRGAIGMQVQNCHPQKSVHLVNEILADFKAGKREVAEFWIDAGDKKVHIRYWPVRGADGEYLGCLETVQDIADIQKLKGEKRL